MYFSFLNKDYFCIDNALKFMRIAIMYSDREDIVMGA